MSQNIIDQNNSVNITNNVFSVSLEQFNDIQTFVEVFLNKKNYEILPNKSFKDLQNRLFKTNDILRELYLAYDSEYKKLLAVVKNKDIMLSNPRLIELALTKYIDESWSSSLSVRKVELSFDQSLNLSELEKFCVACTGSNFKSDLYVMAHFIWQIKRKISNKNVKNHIMPIFIGKQNSGKSTAIEYLTSTIDDYRTDISISALADERNYHSIEDHFVIVCDEMQGCERTDIDRLKNIITAKTISARRLYTNIRDKIYQTASFIGTSNKAIEQLIKDESGIRRFYPVKCIDLMDWDVIANLDYIKIWKSIDENNDKGYLYEVIDDVRNIQESHRVLSPVEEYLVERDLIPAGITQTIPIDALFKDYCSWCEKVNVKPIARSWFSRNIKELGIVLGKSGNVRNATVSDKFVPYNKVQLEQLIQQVEDDELMRQQMQK